MSRHPFCLLPSLPPGLISIPIFFLSTVRESEENHSCISSLQYSWGKGVKGKKPATTPTCLSPHFWLLTNHQLDSDVAEINKAKAGWGKKERFRPIEIRSYCPQPLRASEWLFTQ